MARAENYGRSMVITQQGIAATSQTLASQAWPLRSLRRADQQSMPRSPPNAVLAVVEPMKTGLGGDLFVLYREGNTGKLVGLNASGPAPKALSPEFLARKGGKTIPSYGIHTFTVP